MKKIRRLCIHPRYDSEPKMHTLYECIGKVGTTATTVLWFMDVPQIGVKNYAIDEVEHLSPYNKGYAFRYAEFKSYMIDDIYHDGYVICHLN